MVIQTPIQKAQAVLGILIGLLLLGWILNCSMKEHLLAYHRGTDSRVVYMGYVRVAIFTRLIFSIGAILGICYIIWTKWFDRFNRK
jgi:hypothetical protein